MTENIVKAYTEASDAAKEIFRSSSGSSGYHLVYAIESIIRELEDIRKLIESEVKK